MVIRTAHHSTRNTSCFGIQLNHVDLLEDRCFVRLISVVLSDLHNTLFLFNFLTPLNKVGGDYRNAFHLPAVCPSVTFRVRAITYLYIDGLPYNWV